MSIESTPDRYAALQKTVVAIAHELSLLRVEPSIEEATNRYFVNRLAAATENTLGCIVLARAQLFEPAVTVSRSLLEAVIMQFWGCQETSNAAALAAAGGVEYRRIIVRFLSKGRASVRRTTSGEDASADAIKALGVPGHKRLPNLLEMAESSGIADLYDRLYGALSIVAHGKTDRHIGDASRGEFEGLDAVAQSAVAYLEALLLIVRNKVRESRGTLPTELSKALGIV